MRMKLSLQYAGVETTFFDAQGVGTAEDPLEYSAASLARAIADEYDSQLAEIEAGKPK